MVDSPKYAFAENFFKVYGETPCVEEGFLDFQPLNVFRKSSIFDVRLGSEYACILFSRFNAFFQAYFQAVFYKKNLIFN